MPSLCEKDMVSNILVFNCGSSSQSYKVYHIDQSGELSLIASGKAYHVGVKTQEAAYLVHQIGSETIRQVQDLPTHREAAHAILNFIHNHQLEISWVGHRFVHGGVVFQASTLLTPQTLTQLKACFDLAPIHNPNSLSVIEVCTEVLPQARQYVTFDTAFHASLPEHVYRYALPVDLADEHHLRKYGFHGLSYQYVTQKAAHFLQQPLENLKIIACHLGTGGSSVTAIAGGRSQETSMGYSPLPGLIMSTRSGDFDPAILLMLIEKHGYSAAELNRILNKESGLLGISGASSDLFELVHLAGEKENQRARLAVEMYVHRLKSYIGAYIAVLGGLDVLIFTDDLGVKLWQVRQAVCQGMEYCGMHLDRLANQQAAIDRLVLVSERDSRVKILAIPTDEEIVIAQEGLKLMVSSS